MTAIQPKPAGLTQDPGLADVVVVAVGTRVGLALPLKLVGVGFRLAKLRCRADNYRPLAGS